MFKQTVSRILSRMIIYLDPMLPSDSSCLPNLALHQVEFTTVILSPGTESRSLKLKGYPIFNLKHHDTFHFSLR